MHESSVVRPLIAQVTRLSEGRQPVEIRLRIGPLSGISAAHLREHWREDGAGTAVEGAKLMISEDEDFLRDGADGVILESITWEERP